MTIRFATWSAAPFAGLGSRLGLEVDAVRDRSEHADVLRVFLADRLDEGVHR